MLHKTIVSRNPDELICIVELQIRLLELAAKTARIDRNALEQWFTDGPLVDYLTQNWPRMIGALKDFARTCPPQQKAALINDVIAEIRHDADFWKRYDDPGFVLEFGVTDQYRQHIAEWLRGFYEQFCKSGFDSLVVAGQPWNKRAWVEAFRHKNPDVRMCPQCDGTLHNGVTAEHIFPREKRPSLSVHAANLIPCCQNCQEQKANKDPIENAPPKRLFLPYWQHALEHCEVKASIGNDGQWRFKFVSVDAGADWQDAIWQIEHLYGIPSQWNQRAQQIVDLAIAKIQEKLDADQAEGRPVGDRAEFQTRLGRLCTTMRGQWGRQHYFVPTTAWIEWAKDNMLDELWGQFGAQGAGI